MKNSLLSHDIFILGDADLLDSQPNVLAKLSAILAENIAVFGENQLVLQSDLPELRTARSVFLNDARFAALPRDVQFSLAFAALTQPKIAADLSPTPSLCFLDLRTQTPNMSADTSKITKLRQHSQTFAQTQRPIFQKNLPLLEKHFQNYLKNQALKRCA